MTDTTEETPAPRKLSPEVRRSLAAVKAGTANETEFQRVVIQYAKDHGWLVHHATRCKVKDGAWMTPVWGHPGYPDVTMTRDGRLLLLELKANRGGPSDQQQQWLWALQRVGGPVHAGVYYVRDWPQVRALLR